MENDNDINNENSFNNQEDTRKKSKKKSKKLKFFLKLLCVFILIVLVWMGISQIGRISPEAVIPVSSSLRMSVYNPIKLIDGILAHESLHEITAIPALSQALPLLKSLEESSVFKNSFVRFIARGRTEAALLPSETGALGTPQSQVFLAALDMGFFSPLLRILPAFSGFIDIPNLYHVKTGGSSYFEYRMEDKTLFIGYYKNLLIISDNQKVFESCTVVQKDAAGENKFTSLDPSSCDAALLLSPEFISGLLSEQDEEIEALFKHIEFDSMVEAGFSVYPKKIEFRLIALLASRQAALNSLLAQKPFAPVLEERLPASQYATILSAGTLEELYRAALVFSPGLEETLNRAERSSRTILGLTLDDLLFSWTGKEFAVIGMEGRPHPVYVIQIKDEKKRQAVFDKAFRSFFLDENVKLNLDGTRIPRIEVPEFLQSLLRRWNLFLPSPYYIINKDYFMISESAEALLSALRAMQRNDVLPKTAAWREIGGGKAAAGAFSLYYSLDRSTPFFLRNNTVLSGFLGIYRQGLVRVNINRGLVDISLVLVPGSGNGVSPVNGYPLEIGGNPSNKIFLSGSGENSRFIFTRGNSAVSVNPADNTISEFAAQGSIWAVPADSALAWTVSAQGRVTLINGEMEAERGFPVLTGIRLSAPPVSYNGKLYLCGEDGKIHTIDTDGNQSAWETTFYSPLRSPPAFLAFKPDRTVRHYAAVYPKSFFGEIWLLDLNGGAFPNWPVSVSSDNDFGIGFGSPLLFALNNLVYAAFVSQAGELSVFNESADLVSPFPVQLEGVFYQQPVFDGEFFWLASADGNLFRVSLAGEILYQQIPAFSVKEEGFITVFDCDGDKIPEIFITGEGNALHAYSRNFRSLEGFPLPVWGQPLFIEAQGRKKAEIIGMGMDRRLYRWVFK
jgi:outer membrane protein assembly factor BamB